MALFLTNTLTRRKEEFIPIEPGRVGMYNCGPTVYGFAHIGNFSSFLMADLLRRHLEKSGYRVTQVMNITDVGHLTEDSLADAQGEDKLERKAREEKRNPWEIARQYEMAFHQDRKLLNLLDAHHFPRATENIPQMIEIIQELLRVGLAYEAGGQVYFEIAKFPRYGILSGNTPAELLAGAGNRVEEDPAKRHPLDFCLWKKDPKHIIQWDSPWGRGFPGWHIECSAMSRRYLGPVFDIHTGGEDNIFPHHECEIAQSSGGEDRIFARYWLHRRHILVDGKKMSKSEGNFYTIGDLIKEGYSGSEIRYALLSAHYGAQLNFTLGGLDAARESIRRMRDFCDDMRNRPAGPGGVEEIQALGDRSDATFRAALDDDLNISAALAAVFSFIREAHKVVATRAQGDLATSRLEGWDRVLGVLRPVDETTAGGAERATGGRISPEEVERIVGQREEARKRKDYAESDRLRKLLVERGVAIKDGPQGTRWSYS